MIPAPRLTFPEIISTRMDLGREDPFYSRIPLVEVVRHFVRN